MKYLKTFESEKINIGDIVVCIDGIHFEDKGGVPFLGKKYKVLRIYQEPESKYDTFVEIEDILTGEILNGWLIDRFGIEYEYDAKKYNL